MSETGESTPVPAGRPGHVRWRRLLVYGMAAAAVAAFAGHRFGGRGEAVLAGAAVLGLVIWRLPHLRRHFHNPYRRGPGSLNYPGQAGRGLIRPSRPRAGSGLPRLTRPRRSSSLPSPSGRRRGGAGLIPGRSRRLSRPGGASPARSGARRGGMLRTRRHAGTTPRARRGGSPGTGRGGAGSARAGRRAARRVSAGLSRSGRAGSRGLLNRRGTAGTGRRAGTGRSPLPSRWHPVARRRAAGTGRHRAAGTARRAGAGRSPIPSRWHPVRRHRAATARRRASTRRGAPARPGRMARIRAGAWRAARNPGGSWRRLAGTPGSGWRRVTGTPQQPRGLRRAAHRVFGTPGNPRGPRRAVHHFFGTPPQRRANRAARKMRRARHRARVRAARVRAAAGAYGHLGHGWMFWRRLTRRAPRTHAATGRRLTRRQRLARWRNLRRGRHVGLGLGAGQFLARLRNRPPRPLLAGSSPAMARFRRSAPGRMLAGLDRRRRDRWMRRHRRHAPAPVRRPGIPVPAVPGWGARPARTFTNRSRTGRGHPVADVHAAADELRGMVQNWFDANDLDQTLEGLHEFPRAMQESFSALAEQLRENTNLADRIPEAVAQAASDMTGVAERLREAIEYGVQRS